jgi:hypothetical protein
MVRMTLQRWGLMGGALVLVAAMASCGRGQEKLAVDLIKEFPTAKKQPNEQVISLVDAKLGSETKPSIFVSEPGRITWHVAVPDNAWLKFSLGIKEEAWTTKGDGVKFLVFMSDGRTSDKLMDTDINPFGVPGDRRWRDFTLDLSQYAGETLDLIFTVYSGPPSGHDDRNGDLALWGAPRIVVR